MAEVDETIKRLSAQRGVEGILIVNTEGILIRSVPDNNNVTIHYVGLYHSLIQKAQNMVRELDPSNDLTFLRVRSKKNEVMVAPDKEYTLIVIQNPNA